MHRPTIYSIDHYDKQIFYAFDHAAHAPYGDISHTDTPIPSPNPLKPKKHAQTPRTCVPGQFYFTTKQDGTKAAPKLAGRIIYKRPRRIILYRMHVPAHYSPKIGQA